MATKDEIAAEIRVELRSILRQLADLQTPIQQFSLDASRAEGRPRYYVLFDTGPRIAVKQGLLLGGLQRFLLPDERIIDLVYSLAKSIWQLKDRIKKWVVADGRTETPKDVEDFAAKHSSLMLTADLANWKKHGDDPSKIRSGDNPRVSQVAFDFSKSGKVEIYYQGVTKHKEVLVAEPNPISFAVPVSLALPTPNEIDAIDLLGDAFKAWLPFIGQVKILAADAESDYLRQILYPASGPPTLKFPLWAASGARAKCFDAPSDEELERATLASFMLGLTFADALQKEQKPTKVLEQIANGDTSILPAGLEMRLGNRGTEGYEDARPAMEGAYRRAAALILRSMPTSD